MLKSILTSAFRNIFRNRAFSLINLTGLALSMSLGLLIILIIKSQYSFDTFHVNANQIYRINTEATRAEGGSESYASVPLAVADALVNDYGYVEELVRLDRQLNGEAKVENTLVPVRGLFADPSFLSVFNFPLQYGDASSALDKPNSMVLSKDAARKLFGERAAIGEIVSLGGYGEFTVTGVLESLKGPTHFEFEALVSFSSIPLLEQSETITTTQLNWNNYYTGYAYVKLREGITPKVVEAALEEIFEKHYADVQYETRDKGYRFYLQPLTAITPGPILSNNMGRGMPELLLIFLGALAGVVMLMACFNYTQLMIAKSLTRAKEIGIRKIVGAHRWQVFVQFVGEAIVFALFSLVFAYLLLQFLKPEFSSLHLSQEFTVDLNEDYFVIGLFLIFAITMGAIAGLLPAGYLSAFKPLKVLRGAGDVKVYSRLTFRKVLTVSQFTFSLIFIVLIITIHKQVSFMTSADYGFDQKNMVNIRLRGAGYDNLANEIRGLAGVVRVGGVSHSLGTWADGASDYKRNREDDLFVMRDFSVDENYLLNLDVPFIAGKNFEAGANHQIILNEKALERFGFERAADAVGQTIFIGDSAQWTINGVVANFNFRPLSYEIGPVAFRYTPQRIGILNAKIDGDRGQLIASMESIWKKTDSRPFEWSMMEDEIKSAYDDAGFFDVITIVSYIAILAITLACLGLLGMVMYATQTRVKEIGVRKVMGASAGSVLILLTKSFMLLIGMAIIIGLPFGFLLSTLFLDLYAYKIEITPLLMLSAVGIISLLGLVTVCSQTLKAASANPVDSLRYE